MNPQKLQSDHELYNYMVWLSSELKSKGKIEIAEQVRFASQYFSGSPSEYLHEAQKAIQKVVAEFSSALTDTQIADAMSVIKQIESSFKKVGGA